MPILNPNLVPAGYNGAIDPKLKACISQDCNLITLSDVTGITSVSTPNGWLQTGSPPYPRRLIAFNLITVSITNSSGTQVGNLIVYNGVGNGVNLFPDVQDFSNEMPLATIQWGQPDGVYSFTYTFTYYNPSNIYGDPVNLLGLAGKSVVQQFNQVVTCNAQNAVKDLWLKYLNNCCSANKQNALEAEALLHAVNAAAACADEFNAVKIKTALDKILTISTGSCNVCSSSKCKCS